MHIVSPSANLNAYFSLIVKNTKQSNPDDSLLKSQLLPLVSYFFEHSVKCLNDEERFGQNFTHSRCETETRFISFESEKNYFCYNYTVGSKYILTNSDCLVAQKKKINLN